MSSEARLASTQALSYTLASMKLKYPLTTTKYYCTKGRSQVSYNGLHTIACEATNARPFWRRCTQSWWSRDLLQLLYLLDTNLTCERYDIVIFCVKSIVSSLFSPIPDDFPYATYAPSTVLRYLESSSVLRQTFLAAQVLASSWSSRYTFKMEWLGSWSV